ncbi:protein of unknown function [Methylocaldum szegediense]|uniref:Transposase n=1 Tax=Methylocaldum szegediense TaxID=73780 RepID=A0ABM9I1M4_9GAMM|nr:protein of unknown function [Methylocaldum szegediense]
MELRHDPRRQGVRRQLRAQLGAVVRLRSHNRYISRAVMKKRIEALIHHRSQLAPTCSSHFRN